MQRFGDGHLRHNQQLPNQGLELTTAR
jgi:hypothetical protein